MTSARTQRVPSRISMVADIVEGVARISKRGVPHVVVGDSGDYGSACYFRSTRMWKFFYPYAADNQTVKTFRSMGDLIKYILKWKAQ